MNFNFLNTTFVSNFVVFALIIVGVIYLFSKVRQQDLEVLRASNTDLRASIEDSQKKIEELSEKINLLQAQVLVLEKKNKTLEDLVVTALKQYFFENPKVASKLKDIVNPS